MPARRGRAPTSCVPRRPPLLHRCRAHIRHPRFAVLHTAPAICWRQTAPQNTWRHQHSMQPFAYIAHWSQYLSVTCHIGRRQDTYGGLSAIAILHLSRWQDQVHAAAPQCVSLLPLSKPTACHAQRPAGQHAMLACGAIQGCQQPPDLPCPCHVHAAACRLEGPGFCQVPAHTIADDQNTNSTPAPPSIPYGCCCCWQPGQPSSTHCQPQHNPPPLALSVMAPASVHTPRPLVASCDGPSLHPLVK